MTYINVKKIKTNQGCSQSVNESTVEADVDNDAKANETKPINFEAKAKLGTKKKNQSTTDTPK
ncbi:hypothetical protein T03_5014 [Trichinella britovi]|uniref:Uncharacterized protein n=1 Tax=Trichinella britovi TaxID=45882 RepID=A0A0V1CMC9_TRIBR|nr:hypothetical protein T03_5014 [Trichinella britovi]